MAARTLEFVGYFVSLNSTSTQVFAGPCVLDTVVTIDPQAGHIFTLFDSITVGGRIIMHASGLALPRINMSGIGVELTNGLFLVQDVFVPCNWMFSIARL